MGENPSVLQSGYHSDVFFKMLWETINAGKVWSGVFKNKKKNGELYWEQATISPIRNNNDEIVNFVAVKEDENKLAVAYKVIKENNDKIRQSINYAKRIQTTVLPPISTNKP